VISTPEVRRAREVIRADAKAKKAARPAKVMPTDPKQRRVRQRDPGFLAYLRRQACSVAGPDCSGPIEACHIRYATLQYPNPGLQSKSSDRRAVSMCTAHHRQGPRAQHSMNERRFWSLHGKDPDKLAETLYAQYLNGVKP